MLTKRVSNGGESFIDGDIVIKIFDISIKLQVRDWNSLG